MSTLPPRTAGNKRMKQHGAVRGGGRLLAGLLIAAIAVSTYYCSTQENPITGESQRVALSVEQEIALGLQAAPEMAQQFGGLHPDRAMQDRVDRVGRRVLDRSKSGKSSYQFEFHVLADERTINAFALPGGQIFITAGLLRRLDTDGPLAAVLGHEIAHVVARHGAEHLAKAQLAQGLTGAVAIATYDPRDPSSQSTAAAAAMIGHLMQLRYGREDELESDRYGVRWMAEAGYDPRGMIRLLQILSEAGGGRAPPEFFSTHPNPDRRIERIEAAIAEAFPDGVPGNLEK
jgi:predicted Zn-dependent protease